MRKQSQTISPEARPYLATLRRIPKEIRLSMATREMYMYSPCSCLCGWAIRDAVFFERGAHPPNSARITGGTPSTAALIFGGSHDEWTNVFYDVASDLAPLVEEAFLIAVAEAAEGRRLVK